MRVGALVVTYKRQEVMLSTLAGVLGQSEPPDWAVVVDNDADPRVEQALRAHSPQVTYLASPANVGYGAALAMGMRHLRATHDPDAYWLLDDDTPPRPTALADATAVMVSPLQPWVVANRGGRIRRGRVIHGFEPEIDLNIADFTLVDGALISRAAVEAAGYPSEDLFMMFEDIDYTTRIKRAGGVLVARRSEVDAQHLGGGSGWRAYYQARNHLHFALERRSPSLVFGWAWRTAALVGFDLIRRRWTSLRFRCMGTFDGLRDHMGHDMQPKLVAIWKDSCQRAHTDAGRSSTDH